MLRWIRFVVIAISFLLGNSAWAADPSRHLSQYAHTAWRVQDGFATGTTMAQTTDGYLWFGTSNGLLRFDGVQFTPYDLSRLTPAILGFNYLLGARDGSLWIGARDGLARLKDGKLQWYSDPAQHSGISAILEDPEGTIWFTRYLVPRGEGPLCRVEGSGLHCYGEADGIPVRYGLGLTRDDEGNFWFGSSALCRWRPGSASTYLNDVGTRRDVRTDIIDVAAGRSGKIWATTDVAAPGLGVLWFSGERWANYVVPGFDGRTVGSESLFMDREHSLWIGTTKDGLYRVHDGVGEHYGLADGLSGREVSLVYEDHEGNIWVLTDGGIDMFRDTAVISYSEREGLSAAWILSVLGLQDGSLWIANERVIDVLKEGHRSVLPAKGRFDDHVTALFQDHKGIVWLGCGNRLFAYKGEKFKEVKGAHGSNPGQDWIAAITEDTGGNIWALTQRHHLYRVEDFRAVQVMTTSDGNRLSGGLTPDHKGGFWISSRNDVLTYFEDGKTRTIAMNRPDSSFTVFATFVDSDDALLVATSDGLFAWDGQRWQVLDSHNGLPGNVVYSVLRDDEGALWIRCKEGLVRISDSEFHKWRRQSDSKLVMQVFDRLDGARPGGAPFMIQPSGTKTADGRLWFVAGGKAVQMIDPKQTFRNQIPPPVHVEKVMADRKEYGLARDIELPALTRDVQIDYTALSVTAPQKVFFRYQLEGHDGGWQEAGTRRQAFYNDLPPANYRFRVIASNNSGVWNEAGASFDFSIARAYYQTNLFRTLCVAAVLAFLWGVYQYRVRCLERRQELLLRHQGEITALNERLMRAQEEERSRIAGELHDGVLQQITSVSLLLGAVKRQPDADAKERIGELQRKLMLVGTDIRQLSHELHPAILQEGGLPAALSAYCEEFGKAHSLHVSCETDETAKDLSPGAALCVYRIAQEALGNVVKHSKAKKVQVRLTRADTLVCLSVSDDGAGFAPDRAGESGGLGLVSMRERVRQLHGTLELVSEPGRGTTVRAEVPFRPAS